MIQAVNGDSFVTPFRDRSFWWRLDPKRILQGVIATATCCRATDTLGSEAKVALPNSLHIILSDTRIGTPPKLAIVLDTFMTTLRVANLLRYSELQLTPVITQ